MRRYAYDDLVGAFIVLDRAATSRRSVVVIGGAAVVLHIRASFGTKDIDTYESDVGDLVRACLAQGIELPSIGNAGVSDFPYDFEDRLQRVLPELEHLELYVPERHDLVLSKVLRWAPGDREHVRELHESQPLAKETLIGRYLEMEHVMGNRSEHDWNFVHCIDALFDEIAADDARERVAQHRRKH
jgi:hypothetical protein